MEKCCAVCRCKLANYQCSQCHAAYCKKHCGLVGGKCRGCLRRERRAERERGLCEKDL